MNEIARRGDVRDPGFAARRRLQLLEDPGDPEIDALAKIIAVSCAAESTLSRAEAQVALAMNHAVASERIGEAIVAVAGVVALVRDVFGRGRARERTLWNVLCRSRKEAVVKVVLTAVKLGRSLDGSVEFNEEVLRLIKELVAILHNRVLQKNPRLLEPFKRICIS
jgi:hypothetical protein